MNDTIGLFKHQQRAIEIAKRKNLALFHDCGCGKTVTALSIIDHHRRAGRVPALVVCPLSIIESAWAADCRKFFPHLSIVSLWSQKPADRYRKLNQDHDIYVVNFETMRGMFDAIQAKGFSVIIVDESSRMKSHKSQTTRALLALAGVRCAGKGKKFDTSCVIPHRYVLSGTPAPNDRSEYWGQMTFVEPGKVFNSNFYTFRGRYFVPRPLGYTGINLWDFTKDAGIGAEFNQRVSSYADVVSKEDAADLPEQVHLVRRVQLSKPEMKAYETFRNELVLKFSDEEVLASSALVEIMKARQLTSGFCYGGTGIHRTGTSKLKELAALLEEIGNKQVIIWCSFRHEIAEILKMLPNAAALWGGTTDREKVISDFKTGKCQYLVANPQSAGHGLTFVNCSYAVYFSLNYSYELQKQSQDRIHRIGQTSQCCYYYLTAANTIDELIYTAVREKQVLSERILKYLRD